MNKKHVAVIVATELFPDYIYKRPEEALSDPKFVFEKY